jgi:2-polyprenyl-6-hydroxyphenyl methylase/3-demethylubiquinone-9 3-methyltransferase
MGLASPLQTTRSPPTPFLQFKLPTRRRPETAFASNESVPVDPDLTLRLTGMRCTAKQPERHKKCELYGEDAAQFYAKTFPDSSVGAVNLAPGDFPSGKQGDVLTVEFTVMGIPCVGLNGGPTFKHNEAFSFQVASDDQAETDCYWNVGNGGQESAFGWCKDKWGLSWQITPIALT